MAGISVTLVGVFCAMLLGRCGRSLAMPDDVSEPMLAPFPLAVRSQIPPALWGAMTITD